MNKTELIKSIATGANVSQAQVARMLLAMQETVASTLQNGEKVSVRGFGAFTVVERSARNGYNPNTRAPMQVPASRTVRFVPAEQIKSQLN